MHHHAQLIGNFSLCQTWAKSILILTLIELLVQWSDRYNTEDEQLRVVKAVMTQPGPEWSSSVG